jgi:hypothetical protein
MARTPGSYTPLTRTSRGLITRAPHQGLARTTAGLITGTPAADIPVTPGLEDIGPGSVDANGIQIFLGSDIRDIRFVEVSQQLFANPDEEYTGYTASGFWYTNGVADPTHIPFKATWASEGEGTPTIDRGPLDRFPARLFIYTTNREVVLLNADDLTVWLRVKLLTTVVAGIGNFLGDNATIVRQADFVNGYLVVATSEGLRIADFKNDLGFFYGASAASRSEYWVDTIGEGLVNRNTDAFSSFSALGGPRNVVNDDCLCLDTGVRSEIVGTTKNNVTVCGVGHPDGYTGVRLVYPSSSFPETVESPQIISYISAWSMLADAGPGSPFFSDGVSNWAGDGVRALDTLQTDIGTTHTITEVNALYLRIDPELPLAAVGASYTVLRQVRALAVTEEAYFYFANGSGMVTYVPASDWYETPINGFLKPFDTIEMTNPGIITDMAIGPSERFFATSVGVFYANEQSFIDGNDAEFRYSSAAYTDMDATYKILRGDIPSCSSITIDPETGHLLVATTTGLGGHISEIDTSIQQMFRFVDRDYEVGVVMAYRNAQGPPDTGEV